MGRVVVVGSLNVDRTWRVARHPRVGETVLGEVREPGPGGKGLNQAVAAARMGGEVALVGRLGADDDGTLLRGVAAVEGIDLDAIAVDDDLPTGAALIVVADDGANTVTVAPGANRALVVSDDALGLGSGDVVVAQLEVPVTAVADAFAAARAAGAVSVLNPSPVGDGRSLVAAADVVVVNQAEAAELSGAVGGGVRRGRGDRSGPGDRGGERTVVVTLGAAGAVAVAPDGEPVVVAGTPVEAVDTTGAGDCFLGVFAAGLADGGSLGEAVVRANRAAAIAVTRPGTVPAMPTAAEVSASS